MRLKCRYEGDIRIVTVTAETDFAELVYIHIFFEILFLINDSLNDHILIRSSSTDLLVFLDFANDYPVITGSMCL